MQNSLKMQIEGTVVSDEKKRKAYQVENKSLSLTLAKRLPTLKVLSD